VVTTGVFESALGFHQPENHVMILPQAVMGNADGFEKLVRTAIDPFGVAWIKYDPGGIQVTPHDSAFDDVLHLLFP
jgi:hypothetical protein